MSEVTQESKAGVSINQSTGFFRQFVDNIAASGRKPSKTLGGFFLMGGLSSDPVCDANPGRPYRCGQGYNGSGGMGLHYMDFRGGSRGCVGGNNPNAAGAERGRGKVSQSSRRLHLNGCLYLSGCVHSGGHHTGSRNRPQDCVDGASQNAYQKGGRGHLESVRG